MMWIGILILCAVAAVMLMIAYLKGEGYKAGALIGTFFVLTAILMALASATTLGIMLIMRG